MFRVPCSIFFFSSPVESLCHTCTRGKPKCSEFHVQFFFSSSVESLCHTCTRGKPKCSQFHVQFFFLAHLLRAYAIHVPVASSVVWCKPLNLFFLAHLLRAYAIHVPLANLNVQSSMFNFFLAHLLRAYAIHVPVASSVVWCKPLKIFFSKTAQQNSYILHTNSLWVCVIKVCSNGGATYIIGEIIAKDNLNIENLMQTIENLLLQTCTFTKWKLILSNNEDNNNNIDIINNNNNNDNNNNNNNKNNSVTSSVINSWICFTFLNVFSVKCWSMFNFFLASPVESLCHTCTRGKPKCSEFHVQFFFYLTCWELMPYMYQWHRQFDNLNIENLMQTFENLLLQTCTFTKWKLILSNNEDNNNNIDINIACSSCSWIAPPRYWWRPLH